MQELHGARVRGLIPGRTEPCQGETLARFVRGS